MGLVYNVRYKYIWIDRPGSSIDNDPMINLLCLDAILNLDKILINEYPWQPSSNAHNEYKFIYKTSIIIIKS